MAFRMRDEPDCRGRCARSQTSANGRDDAVGARRVAAHRDLHPRLEAALTVHRQLAGEAAIVETEAPTCDAEAAGTEPLAEMRDRARPERDVDVRIELEQTVTLRFRITASDGDHLVRVASLDRGRLREVRSELLIGFLTDRAGVDDADVRV